MANERLLKKKSNGDILRGNLINDVLKHSTPVNTRWTYPQNNFRFFEVRFFVDVCFKTE
jgi:hypothetical protein